ncbi:MAG: transcriptional regulator [SAR324 cluster bacterium]|uniref:Transcriptional regulator n=1 Tax=SAR324 cluster bacterium TaxID=2024889 RepID=A0A2A4TB95_9DELT|nr:MAG: transcriptional regulator [SAR324 cluster bacterium]
MNQLSQTFKSLSDPNRLRILKLLESRPLCVCEITEVLQLATSTVSKHLTILRGAGFITDRKQGKWVYYQLSSKGNLYTPALQSLLRDWLTADRQVQADMDSLSNIQTKNLCN